MRNAQFWLWLRGFFRWLRLLQQVKQPSTVEEHYTDRAALLRLVCDQPGVIDLWKLTHRDSQYNLFVSLVYLPQLREDLAQQRAAGGVAPSYAAWRKSLTDVVAGKLDAPAEVAATHLVTASWATRHPIRQISAGKTCFVHRTECAAAIFCDLEGVSFIYGSPRNRVARSVVRAVMIRLMQVQASRSLSWEDRARRWDWTGELERHARAVLGKTHVLQPRIRR